MGVKPYMNWFWSCDMDSGLWWAPLSAWGPTVKGKSTYVFLNPEGSLEHTTQWQKLSGAG